MSVRIAFPWCVLRVPRQWLAWLAFALAALATAPPASALPLFARQTGQN